MDCNMEKKKINTDFGNEIVEKWGSP